MINTPSGSGEPAEEISQNTLVCDVSREKVGHVTLSALRDGYFVVERGWLFPHELFLPATAILAHDADGITLRFSKEELKQDRWKQPPEGDVSDVSVPRAVFPNSPLPGVKPAEEEERRILPPDDIRPLAGEPVPLVPPEEDSPPTAR